MPLQMVDLFLFRQVLFWVQIGIRSLINVGDSADPVPYTCSGTGLAMGNYASFWTQVASI